ncbi:MAG: diaminopimelate decarboxylase [Bacteroidales bacterium]|nr:diaminopimelate decarboxylase [Bacteroidales bacterium]
MISTNTLRTFNNFETPFFYYDMKVLSDTVAALATAQQKYHIKAHYALKANAEKRVLKTISKGGIAAECATGNEIKLALETGFAPKDIFFDGVAKTDKEILFALKSDIACFNCENIQEIEIINEFAGRLGKKAHIAVRVNPDVDAHTHKFITTGMEEDKFGISQWAFDNLIKVLDTCGNLVFEGLHFHIGSQITDLSVFETLCRRVIEIQDWFDSKGYTSANLNLGGGLGVDYDHPLTNWLPDFDGLCHTISENLPIKSGQQIHIEPGRSLVAQCGHIISRVVFIKEGQKKKFAILDCGMHTLIRPALYQAHHEVENLSCVNEQDTYNVVGCVCESSDTFAENMKGGKPHRGDLFAIHSAGAYGQVMNMTYLQRNLAPAVYSDEI